MNTTPISILIIENQTILKNAIQTILEREAGFRVVGVAADGEKGLEILVKLRPDVVIVGLLLPGVHGLRLVTQINQLEPHTRILVTANEKNQEPILSLIQAGALGYFPKFFTEEQLIDAVRKVANGVPYLPPFEMLSLFKTLRELKLKYQITAS